MQSQEKEDIPISKPGSLNARCLHAMRCADELKIASYLSSPPPSFLSLLLYSPPPTISSSLLPADSAFYSRLVSFLLWKACQDSEILIISVKIPLVIFPSVFLPFPFPLPGFNVSFPPLWVSLPFFSVSLHAGEWNVSSLCLRSWGGLSQEKYQIKKYVLTVNSSHCRPGLSNTTTMPWLIRPLPEEKHFDGGLLARLLCRFSFVYRNLNIMTPISKELC